MTKPFDATLNRMIDVRPEEWAACFAKITGIPPGPSVSIDNDLATAVQADKIFRIDGERPSMLHLEFLASSRLGIPAGLMRYNVLAGHQYDYPVETVLLLLRPRAWASDMTGTFRRLGASGNLIHQFHYHVERVWERPAAFWREAGIGLASLSLLTNEAAEDLESAVRGYRNFLSDAGADAETTETLWASSYVLCGLRYDQDFISQTYRRLSMLMEESTTYQHILSQGLSQGRADGERKCLLIVATKRLGEPSRDQAAQFSAIGDPGRLERMTNRVLEAMDWDDLLGTE